MTTFAVVIILAGYGLTQLQIRMSSEDIVEAAVPASLAYRDMKQEFGDTTFSIFVIKKATTFTTREECHLMHWVDSAYLNHKTITSIDSVFDLRRPLSATPEQLRYRRLIGHNCDNDEKEHDAVLSITNSPWKNLYSNSDRSAYIFYVNYRKLSQSRLGSFNPEHANQAFALFQTLGQKIPGAKFYRVGPGDYEYYVNQGLKKSNTINLVFLAFVFLFISLVYRSIYSGLIISVLLLLAGLIIYGFMGLCGFAMGPLSTSIFMLISISCIADFVFLSQRIAQGESYSQAFKDLALPCFLTTLTTFIGFLSLMSSEIKLIRDLGLWTAIGSVIEWLLLFALLPIWLKYLPRKGWVRVRTAEHRPSIILQYRPRRWLALTSLVLFPAAIWSVGALRFNSDPLQMLSLEHEYMQSANWFAKEFGWFGSLYLVHDKNEATHFQLDRHPYLSQEINNTKILQYFTENLPSHFHPLIADAFLTSRASEFFTSNEHYRSLLLLNSVQGDAINQTIAAVQAECGTKCVVTGGLANFAQLSQLIPQTLIRSFVTSICLVALVIVLLALAKDQRRKIPILLLSAFWGVAAILVILGLMRFQVNLLTCIFASVIVGITGDNAIHFSWFASKQGLSQSASAIAPASLTTAMLMASGSLIFLASYFDPPKILGGLLCAGILLSFIGDLYIVKALDQEDATLSS